ncbi:MAG TPA: YibE/F family protein [Nitriliruptoraceae bacterium]|nr:YibE/F family protein [Nitriliruptoraceae bacterium]
MHPLTVTVGVIVVATTIGMVLLWPARDVVEPEGTQSLTGAEVLTVASLDDLPEDAPPGSQSVDVTMRLTGGPDQGEVVTTQAFLEGLPELVPGQQVRVVGNAADGYYIADYERSSALWLLAALFVIVVVAASGWQGLRSLIGLAISLVIVIAFVVPAILAGSSPAAVALVGAVGVLVITLYLSHGFATKTSVAVVGTTIALAITVGLGVWFIDAAVITGYSSEEAVQASFQIPGLDVSGLVLAGLIIATLGVLDDVTVAQASTVQALHDTDPAMTSSRLVRVAMVVGRDHIASTINTLFLAYAGASLTLLVIFSTGGRPIGDIITSELVAAELVQTLVGSLGLIAAVPITTLLAAVMVVRRSPDEVEASRLATHGTTHAH